tara:strand:+ start:90 stop:527 length:438 start_codon:yes stop_codon:yes gene_type:complete
MNINKQLSKTNIKYLISPLQMCKLRYILAFLSGLLLLPIQQVQSERIFLKCTGKFEIDRGELIKPDWETSYITINLDGLISSVFDNGVKKEGRTLIRRGTYIVTYRDSSNKIRTSYKIHGSHGNYIVYYPQSNRTLIGTCQKGKG